MGINNILRLFIPIWRVVFEGINELVEGINLIKALKNYINVLLIPIAH